MLWWQPTGSRFETSYVYLNVARHLCERGYRRQLAFGEAWFARIRLGDRFPRWTVTSTPFGEGFTVVGPFLTRKDGARFVESIQDIFDLCRYHHILERAPHGQACAYFDMGKCPAPCDGSIDMARYRAILQASAGFATGADTQFLESQRTAMAEAASELDFEAAKRIKERIERAEAAVATGARICASPERFRWLIVQRGSTRSKVRPFLVMGGLIEAGDELPLSGVEAAAGQWIDRMLSSDKFSGIDGVYRAECIWLVTHFIAQGDKATGLIIRDTELDGPRTVASRVTEAFGGTRRASTRG
jgi:hypothetical protein